LWILWAWDECSDDECTFSIDYWVYLSKSIDSGRTFQHMIKQRRGLAAVGNTPSNPLLKMGEDNTVHFLYDSLPRTGETYKLGNDLTYCKLPNGDTTQRIDVRLPQLPDSMDYYSSLFSVSPSGRVHVTVSGSLNSISSYIYYSHSSSDETFLSYKLLDTINPPRQAIPNHILKASKLLLAYLVNRDPFDTLSKNHIFVRESIDDGDNFTTPSEIFIAPYSICAVDSIYYHCVRYSTLEGGLKYFGYVDLLRPPIDSAYIGTFNDPRMVLDDSSGKYIVMNDASHKAYFSKKDVATSITNNHQTIPLHIKLTAFPNPFNPITEIQYEIPTRSMVTLKVYNLLGIEVAVLVNKTVDVGSYEMEWNASTLPTGVYFYRLTTGNHTEVKKMVLMK
jgi:hypothetical protein